MPKIRSVAIEFEGAPPLYITGDEIERMEKATEALELIERAKAVAKRLISLQ